MSIVGDRRKAANMLLQLSALMPLQQREGHLASDVMSSMSAVLVEADDALAGHSAWTHRQCTAS